MDAHTANNQVDTRLVRIGKTFPTFKKAQFVFSGALKMLCLFSDLEVEIALSQTTSLETVISPIKRT